MFNFIEKVQSREKQKKQAYVSLDEIVFDFYLKLNQFLQSNMIEEHNISIDLLHSILQQWYSSIPEEQGQQEAILLLGDSGVGKSTILAYLNDQQLMIKLAGLKPTLDSVIKKLGSIGHDKYSERSVPSREIIGDQTFFDFPGFNDNKGEEFNIANSFFLQRIFEVYQKVKIILVIDQKHISEPRTQKLPKLLKHLQDTFESLKSIQNSCCIIINRTDESHTEEDYAQAIIRMTETHSNRDYLLSNEQTAFIRTLTFQSRIVLFEQASKNQIGGFFNNKSIKEKIWRCLENLSFVGNKKINVAISDKNKLSMKVLADEYVAACELHLQKILVDIIGSYSEMISCSNRNSEKIIYIKESVIRLMDQIRACKKGSIVSILQRYIPPSKLNPFIQGLNMLTFLDKFIDISMHFECLINKINQQLSELASKLQKRILILQKQQLASKPVEFFLKDPLENLNNSFFIFEQKKSIPEVSKMKIKPMVNRNLKQQLKNVLQSLSVVEGDLMKAKSRTYELHKQNLCFEAKKNQEMLNDLYMKSMKRTGSIGITLIR